MKVWVIQNDEGYIIDICTTGIIAYKTCKNYIENQIFDDEQGKQDCIQELDSSFTDDKDKFGVFGVIDAELYMVSEE